MSRLRKGPRQLFDPGDIVATPGALKALAEASTTVYAFLIRHLDGDWGDVDSSDKRLNDAALKNGSRIMSAYTLTTGVKIWVITEAVGEDGKRSFTTFLLPEEY